jgi:hypothetical protein
MTDFKLDKYPYHKDVSKYLSKINITCKFFADKHITKTNYTLISVVAFKLKKSYKASRKYSEGLSKIISYMQKNNSNLILRVYYDCSIINTKIEEIVNIWIPMFQTMHESDNIQLVRYQFDEFLDNEKYHEGLFGTIVRTIPMFDFDGAKDHSLVVCTDIDGISGFLKSVQGSTKVNKWNYDMVFGTRMCLTLSDRHIFTYLDKYSFDYRIMAGILYIKKGLPREILKTFLQCMIDDCSIYKDWIKNVLKNTMKSNKIEITSSNKWVYGIDEFFINRFILIHMLEEKEKIALFIVSEAYDKTFFIMRDILHTSSPAIKSSWDLLFKKILGQWYVDDLNKNSTLLDNSLYTLDKPLVTTQMKKTITANYIKEMYSIITQKQTKKYMIPDEMSKCFLENYKHTINQIYEVKYSKGTVVVAPAKGKIM